MEKMSGGQAIVKTLIRHEIDTVFGLPGIQLDHTFDALYEARNQVRTVHTRHEQGAAYMATGYAASTGKVGTFMVVPGPGILNTGAALSTAVSLNAPVLGLTGQIPSYQIGVGMGMTHEIRDQLMSMRGVVKWADRAEAPADVPAVLGEAFKQMLSERTQPVVFEMAPDQMGRQMDVELLDAVISYPEPEIDDDDLASAAKLLGQAKNPMIFVGGGIFGAEAELLQLAELLEAPVIASRTGRGAMSDRHHLSHGMVSGQELWSDVDAALVIGTKWLHPAMAWGRGDIVKTVRVDIDPAQAALPKPHDITIIARAKTALAKLAEAVEKHNISRPSRKDELTKAKNQAAATLGQMTQQRDFAQVIREELPEDGIIVSDVTQMGTFCQYGMPFYQPRTLVMTGYQGTLGAGYAMALGAQVSGDGGFMFNVQEMSTAVKHGINVVCIVFADAFFGNVKRIQNDAFGGRNIGVELENPDFVQLAKAFGMLGIKARTADELRKAIREAFNARGPVLIEVPVGDLPSIWDYIKRPPSAGLVAK
jgi:acetolactate synthase-1/2/3 large subunit